MFETYADRAKAAHCPACRTVSMIGMMCGAAVKHGGFLAFVGQGYGGDWPDPREPVERSRGTDSTPHNVRR